MPQSIIIAQLTTLQNFIKTGGVDAAVQSYASLYTQGYGYAGWAKGVAAGDTISGEAALNYLQGTALMGLGGEQCRNLTQPQIDKIRIDMAQQTLEKYQEIAGRNNGVLNRDLKYGEIKQIHEDVLTNNQLSLDN
jgi:hypothetical protein